MERVTSDRAATGTELTEGQFLVMQGMEEDWYVLDVFGAEDEAHAKVLAESRRLGAGGRSANISPDRVANAQMQIIKEIRLKRKSFASCCSGWRRLIAPQDAAVLPPPPAVNLVGKFLLNVPVVDSEDTSVALVLSRARVVEENGGVLTVDDGEDEDVLYLVKKATAVPLLEGTPRPSIDASCLGADLLRVLRGMPHTAKGRGKVVDSEELQELAATSGVFAFTRETLASSALDSSEFRYAGAALLRELVQALDGKVLGTDGWPSDPAALGEALKRRAGSGTFVQIEEVVQVQPKELPPALAADVSRYPMASALRSRCVSTEQWTQFLTESVQFTAQPSSEDRRVFLRAAETRMMKSLDQFLVRHGESVESLRALKAGQSASELEDVASDVSEKPIGAGGAQPALQGETQASLAAVGAAAAGAGASIGDQLGALLGRTNSKGGKFDAETEEVASAMREAAKRLRTNEAALGRLRAMRLLAVANDYVALAVMQSEEKDQDVMLLLNSGVADDGEVRNILSGELGDGTISVIVGVRCGLAARLFHTLFPIKPERSERQAKAIQRVRLGKLSGTQLLHIIDLADTGTKEAPFAGFAKMGAAAEGAVTRVFQMMQQVVSLVSPAQTSESMQFFRQLPEVLLRYRERGASWRRLSQFWIDLVRLIERPAKAFARGGGAGVFWNLDLALLSRTSAHALELDDFMREDERSSTRETKAPADASKTKTGKDTKSKGGALTWEQQKAQLCSEVAAVGGKPPCPFHFINGACKFDTGCKGHHGRGAADAKSFVAK